MAVHWYILPFDTAARAPAHMEPPEDGMAWACLRYIHSGDDTEFVGIVRADVSAARHAAIVADPACIALPDIDSTIAPAEVRSFLDARNIPSGWVQAGMTYRTVLRVVCRMGIMWQRLRGITRGAKVFGAGITLDTQISSLPVNVRQTMAQLAQEYGVPTAGITTIREALLAWYQSERISGENIVIMGEVL